MTEDEMVGRYYQLNGHEFGLTLGVADDREAWRPPIRPAIHGVTKSQT